MLTDAVSSVAKPRSGSKTGRSLLTRTSRYSPPPGREAEGAQGAARLRRDEQVDVAVVGAQQRPASGASVAGVTTIISRAAVRWR